jgi:NTE family protein
MEKHIWKYLVLSGGGCRGFAHLGAVKALREHGFQASAISGTSAGAIAGAFLADGFAPDEIMEIFAGKLSLNLIAWNGFRLGLISMKKIAEFMEKNLRHKKFEQLPTPLFVTCTNFLNGRQTIFNTGEIIPAVIASSSIPALFTPEFIGSTPYVDGGLTNNLPVEPFADEKSKIIAVYVNPIKPFQNNESVVEVLDRAIHLSFRTMVGHSASGCALYIEPTDLHQFGMFDIQKLREIFDIGYQFTKKILEGRVID